MLSYTHEHAQQIAVIEALLAQPMIGSARQPLETTLQALRGAQGSATISGTMQGNAIGVNHGTIQAFFGPQPAHMAKDLLDSYLEALIAEHAQLQLGKLLGKEQTGREQPIVPTLSLRAVYTSLATNHSIGLPVAAAGDTPEAVLGALDAGDPAAVLPEAVRWGTFAFAGADATLQQFAPPAAVPRISPAGGWRAARAMIGEAQHQPCSPFQVLGWYRPELAVEAIASQPRLVLLGNPGSGKSTILRYLVVSLAEALLIGAEQIDLLGWAAAALPVPLFCQLGHVAKQLGADPAHDLDTLIDMLLRPVVAAAGLRQSLREPILHTWRQGGALLCLDGLDEVSSTLEPTADGLRSRRARIADAIRQLARQVGRTRIVVTCRTRPYLQDSAWQLRDPWVTRSIEPFALGQVRFFVPTWYAQTSATPSPEGQRDPRAAALIDAISSNPDLHSITASPLLLTMLVLLHYNQKQLPDERADIYEELVKLLLDRWEGIRSTEADHRTLSLGERLGLPHLRVDHLRPVLHAIAFEAHCQAIDGRGVIPRQLVCTQLDAFFASEIDPDAPASVPRIAYVEKTDQFLDLLVNQTGLLQPEADHTYVLPHLTFEEYLAACHLAGRGDLRLAYEHWCAAGDRWREPMLLLMGRLRQHEKFDVIFAWLELLLTEHDSIAQQQRDLLLAMACYETLGRRRLLARYLPERALLHLERRQRAALLALLSHPHPETRLPQRIEAATALGRLGDPRFPIALDDWRAEISQRSRQFGAPTGYWCYVRPDTYRIGGWDNRGKAIDIALPAFWIARLPITIAQYATFAELGGQPSPDQLPPRSWNGPPYSAPNQPIVGISIQAATAFTRWLTQQLGHLLPAGYCIRMPTEAEWEAAAAYDHDMRRQSYPWGKARLTPERAIYEACGLAQPAPVGCCPAGAAACGALDMAGTIWELTLGGDPRSPTQRLRANTADVIHIARGGSFQDHSRMARCAARASIHPTGQLNLGLRVVVAPQIGLMHDA